MLLQEFFLLPVTVSRCHCTYRHRFVWKEPNLCLFFFLQYYTKSLGLYGGTDEGGEDGDDCPREGHFVDYDDPECDLEAAADAIQRKAAAKRKPPPAVLSQESVEEVLSQESVEEGLSQESVEGNSGNPNKGESDEEEIDMSADEGDSGDGSGSGEEEEVDLSNVGKQK